jgi:phosphoglycerol transferase MdoB-like AlkP superfamily enzyme
VSPVILSRFDTLRREALVHGLLDVPAWGANTMRTEFAVLTGIGDEALGIHRFNPYRRFARGGFQALPHRLRALGYETVCVHPHPKGFFGRDRVFPTLGFDRFIDIADFLDAPHDGPYVADTAVTRKIADVLDRAARPTFVFAITMENHGPLHLERVTQSDLERLYLDPPPTGWDDLTVYLRHLSNADRMFGDLADLLAARPQGGVLCLFGDHVPSMPRVYEDRGYGDARTDYLVWPAVSVPLGRVDLSAHQLPEILLAGLDLPRQQAKDRSER